MRTVPAAIAAARRLPTSHLAKIWRIERTDGVVLRFTEHDRDLMVAGELYQATASFDPSTIKASSDLSVDDMDVQGAFDSDLITASDLLAGRFDGASFTVSEVLWDNPGAGADVLRWGWIGTVKETGGKFLAELLGPTHKLQQPIGKLYSATCRAVLGDAMCRVDMGPHTYFGEVTEAAGRRSFTAAPLPDSSFAPDRLPGDQDYFQRGLVRFTTGANAGLSMEVSSFDGATAKLLLSLPFDIAAGDAFSIQAGCAHSREVCKARFANILNFQGEPDVPVSDDTIKGPVRGVDQGAAATPPYEPVDSTGGGGD